MRTGHLLTICCSLLLGGGVSAPRGVCLARGVPGHGGQGGVCLARGVPGRGVSAPGGVPGPRGVPGPGGCLFWGVSAPGGCLVLGGVPGPGGVCSGGCAWSGGCLVQGVCLVWGGGCIQACTEADTLPPVDRILDTRLWKYYLGPTSLRPVIKRVPTFHQGVYRPTEPKMWMGFYYDSYCLFSCAIPQPSRSLRQSNNGAVIFTQFSKKKKMFATLTIRSFWSWHSLSLLSLRYIFLYFFDEGDANFNVFFMSVQCSES